jgi:hypothetical protein
VIHAIYSNNGDDSISLSKPSSWNDWSEWVCARLGWGNVILSIIVHDCSTGFKKQAVGMGHDAGPIPDDGQIGAVRVYSRRTGEITVHSWQAQTASGSWQEKT